MFCIFRASSCRLYAAWFAPKNPELLILSPTSLFHCLLTRVIVHLRYSHNLRFREEYLCAKTIHDLFFVKLFFGLWNKHHLNKQIMFEKMALHVLEAKWQFFLSYGSFIIIWSVIIVMCAH